MSGQLPPRKIAPRLGLGFGFALALELGLGGRGVIFVGGNCPRTLANNAIDATKIRLSVIFIIFRREHWKLLNIKSYRPQFYSKK